MGVHTKELTVWMKYAAATVDSDLASEKHKNCLTKKLKKQTNIKQTKHKQEQTKQNKNNNKQKQQQQQIY